MCHFTASIVWISWFWPAVLPQWYLTIKMAKYVVFETYSSGNLPTLIISVIAPTILPKLSPHLSQMRSAGAVVGWGEDAEEDLGTQINVNPFMPVRRVNFQETHKCLTIVLFRSLTQNCTQIRQQTWKVCLWSHFCF